MTVLQALGAITGALGAIALVLTAFTNRRQGVESFAHTELVDTVRVLSERVDRAEASEKRCHERLAAMGRRLDELEQRQ